MAHLKLQTATGADIPNEQDAQVLDDEFDRFLRTFRVKWEPYNCVLRKPALLRYNCHGLTFASRRTWIDETGLIPQILADDGYKKIEALEATAGDVIVYYDEHGRAEHSGFVVETERRDERLLHVPRILSKWAKAFEVLHWANRCPYETRFMTYYRLQVSTVKT